MHPASAGSGFGSRNSLQISMLALRQFLMRCHGGKMAVSKLRTTVLASALVAASMVMQVPSAGALAAGVEAQSRISDGSGSSKTGKRYYGALNMFRVGSGWAKPSMLVAVKERPKCSYLALSTVRLSRDDIYVKDGCGDGMRVIAEVGWRQNGVYHVRRCYNTLGGGKTAVCDFEWPEGPVKTLISYRQNSSGKELMGTPQHFRG